MTPCSADSSDGGCGSGAFNGRWNDLRWQAMTRMLPVEGVELRVFQSSRFACREVECFAGATADDTLSCQRQDVVCGKLHSSGLIPCLTVRHPVDCQGKRLASQLETTCLHFHASREISAGCNTKK